MKKILFLPFLLLLLSFKGESCQPMTEGIYVFPLEKDQSAVIRFYADKTVLVSTSINNYKEVMSWFNREPENFSRVLTGKYKLSDCSIRFKVKGETGYQRYEGSISGKSLQLHIVNPDHSTTDRLYEFVQP